MPATKLSQKPIELREADFRRAVNGFTKFPQDLRDAFISYWSEPNKSGSKMKFELEKTWDIGRRLGTWDRNNFGNKSQPVGKLVHMTPPPVRAPQTDIERLDYLLSLYHKNPSGIPFDDLAGYYSAIKENRLWDPSITKGQVAEIRELYKGNETKCKAWAVQRTLMYYQNKGWKFSDTLELRKKLSV